MIKPLSLSLRGKLGIASVISLLLLLSITFGVYAWVLLPSFQEIERKEGEQALGRAFDEVSYQVEFLDALIRDWSSWDDSVSFVQTSEDSFVKSNLVIPTFSSKNLSMMGFYNLENSLVYGRVYDRKLDALIPLTPEIDVFFKDFFQKRDLEKSYSGLVLISGKPFIVVSRPILPTIEYGNRSGTLVALKEFDSYSASLISRRSGARAIFSGWDHSFSENIPFVIDSSDAKTFILQSVLKDIDGQSILKLSLIMDRNFMIATFDALKFAIPLSFLFIVSVILIFLGVIDWFVSSPLIKLHGVVEKLGESYEPIDFPDDLILRSDEIGIISSSISKLHKDLVLTAHKDHLTGLANRVMFSERLQGILFSAARHNRKFAVLMLDLDGFKPVNDIYGHDAGDSILVQVAERLRGVVRENDVIARIGGDEFSMVFSELEDEKDILFICERVISLFKEPFVVPTGESVFVGCTIGGSFFPRHGKSLEDLLKEADSVMYEAKRSGKNQFKIAA